MGGAGGAGGTTSQGGAGGSGGAATGCDLCDPVTEVCSHGLCVPLTSCVTDDDCKNDTFCEPGVGCVPWTGKDPGHDASCINVIAPGVLAPKVKCEFSVAPNGDPFPGHVDVQGTPIVINFNKPADLGPPSIIAAFTATVPNNYTEGRGVLRVLRGSDCSLETNLGGVDVDNDSAVDWIVSSASPAAADLDGDGVAELVAFGADGSTLAFTKKGGVWSLLWKSPYQAGLPWAACDGAGSRCSLGWGGPSIHDLDDDGVPEILREGVVFGADGAIRSLAPPGYAAHHTGDFPLVANLDQDPAIELTNGQFIWEWDGPNNTWVPDPGFPGASSSAPGYTAVADFGAYGTGVPPSNPEIVVVRSNAVMIYAVTGELVQGPVAVPGAGGGGPPTIADFDGDGLPEVGVAGQAYYTVYDIDCGPNPRPNGQCPSATCDFLGSGTPCSPGSGVLWSRQSQDISSNVTGSSVFDFEADGHAEVVYGDECFVRVYDGPTGDVVFSQYRSSCTWNENPVIADVDGNFRADLVTPSNKACSPGGQGYVCNLLDANGVDPLFAGLRCKDNSDCMSGTCDAGLCRCQTGAQCCGAADEAQCLDEGYKCAPPPAGTLGTGNTCRAAHPHGVSGIRVYSDVNDKWVRSRTIWNQHAYAVTHINEDGTVPKTSDWKNNWDNPKLNNFRQNVPGTQNGQSTGDLTAGVSQAYSCGTSGAELSAPICNRGADDIAPGLSVGFYVDNVKVCSSQTTKALAPDACETVTCVWANPPLPEDGVTVSVRPNDDGAYAECKAGNNEGTVLDVGCPPHD
jgi:hypothetical protein